jgi:hypothetical protein
MGMIPTQIILDFQTNIVSIMESEYDRLASSLWWNKVAKVRDSKSLKETVAWLIADAMIRDQGTGGSYSFDDLGSKTTEIENRYAGAAFRVTKAQLTDLYNGIPGGKAFELGAAWAEQIGKYMAYWPQKQTSYCLKNGHTASLFTAYDGKALFATDHLTNPADSAKGTFSNLLSGGSYDVSEAVTVEAALAVLNNVRAHIAAFKMPNGEDPRLLRPRGFVAPPKLAPRLAQLTKAKFIAQAATSGGGSGDIEAYVQTQGYGEVIEADELSGFESDKTFFVLCDVANTSQLGAVVYQEREAFSMDKYDPASSPELGRLQSFEWHVQGRNAIAAGHPYAIVKVKGT